MSQPKTPNKNRAQDASLAKRTLAQFCIPLVAQLLPSVAHKVDPAADLQQLTPEWVDAIRRAKAAISGQPDSKEKPLSLRSLANLADACLRAYSVCDRPVRSDLLSALCSALAVTTMHYNSFYAEIQTTAKILPALGMTVPCPVDALETMAVLAYDLRSNAGFAPPDLGVRIAMSLRDTLLMIPPEIEEFLVEHLHPMLEPMVIVAMSNVFPRGRGFIAPGVGPASARTVGVHHDSEIGLAITYSPDFNCSLTLKREGVSIPMDRDTLRSVMALFLGEEGFILPSYTSASLVMPQAGKKGVLKISNAVAMAFGFKRYLSLQRLFERVQSDPEFIAWADFRATQFGDV